MNTLSIFRFLSKKIKKSKTPHLGPDYPPTPKILSILPLLHFLIIKLHIFIEIEKIALAEPKI